MRTIYLAEKKGHWSFSEELAAKHELARRMKVRKKANVVLGACLLGAVLGKPAGQILAETAKHPAKSGRGGVLVEL